MKNLITALALVGKFAISFTINTVLVATAETYPTEIRNSAISFCSTQAEIGSVISPYIQLLGSLYWFPLPYLIYGITAFIALVSYVIVMPETKGTQLKDKLEEMEEEDS
jgi:OCT family organic cation transporter-like MFS transporter 4/5